MKLIIIHSMVIHTSKITLKFYVQPGAKQTEICGKHGEHIKIRLQAPPVAGKANKALIAFLAEKLNLKSSSIKLIRGQKTRIKTVEILCPHELSQEVLLSKLMEASF